MGNGRIRKRENKFTMVSNIAIFDKNLSNKAVGLYSRINAYLNIPDWDLYKNFLINNFKEGESAFNSAWKELKDAGYLVQYKTRDTNGKYVYEYELLDEITTPRKSTPGKSTSGKTTSGKSGSINKTLSNKTLKNNNKKNIASPLPQYANFEQRTYTEEDYEKFYDNLS